MNLKKLMRHFRRYQIDGLLVTQPENVRYLSGYTGEGVLLITPDRALLATDSRYWGQAERQAPDLELYKIKSRHRPFYSRLLAAAGQPRRVGFEGAHVTMAHYARLLEVKSVEWVAVENIVENMRAVKTPTELALIRRAAAISDAALEHLRTWLRPGMTERQVAWELEVYLRTHGAERAGFDLIVATGPASAEAHHEPDDRPIQAGEPIVVDIGARVHGYCSDVTRTYCLGRPPKRFLKIYDIVRRAQETALAGIHAGLTGQQADALARDVITAAGYGRRFGHGLGHGVGLAVHELPSANPNAQIRLPAGATLTVEPGIYIPGWGGVRIEDLVIICKNGVELVSRASKEPLIE